DHTHVGAFVWQGRAAIKDCSHESTPRRTNRWEKCHETHLDDHRCKRCAEQLQMVPVTLRPARDTTRPCPLWSDPRCGWNCSALPPPVGRARASVVDEPGHRDTWQRAPLDLPRRRFRYGT